MLNNSCSSLYQAGCVSFVRSPASGARTLLGQIYSIVVPVRHAQRSWPRDHRKIASEIRYGNLLLLACICSNTVHLGKKTPNMRFASGPVVRLDPETYSIADLDVFKKLYGPRTHYEKVRAMVTISTEIFCFPFLSSNDLHR